MSVLLNGRGYLTLNCSPTHAYDCAFEEVIWSLRKGCVFYSRALYPVTSETSDGTFITVPRVEIPDRGTKQQVVRFDFPFTAISICVCVGHLELTHFQKSLENNSHALWLGCAETGEYLWRRRSCYVNAFAQPFDTIPQGR